MFKDVFAFSIGENFRFFSHFLFVTIILTFISIYLRRFFFYFSEKKSLFIEASKSYQGEIFK
jgi:hypothetical protein